MYYYTYVDSQTQEYISLCEISDYKKKCGDIVELKGKRYKIVGYKFDRNYDAFLVEPA